MTLIGFWILMALAVWQFYRAWQQSRKLSSIGSWTYMFPTAKNRANPEFRNMWLHYGIGCAIVAMSLAYGLVFVPGFKF